MIRRKCLSLKYDLPPLFCWCVEACHHQMQICGQCLHNSDFIRFRTNEIGHVLLQVIIHVQPWCQVRVRDFLEVTEYAFGRPSVKILLEVLLG